MYHFIYLETFLYYVCPDFGTQQCYVKYYGNLSVLISEENIAMTSGIRKHYFELM